MFPSNCGCFQPWINSSCNPCCANYVWYCVDWPFPGCGTDVPVVITSPANGAIVSTMPTITGIAGPNNTVVAIGNGVVATAIADADGNFTLTPTLPLGNVELVFFALRPGCRTSPVTRLSLVVTG